MDFQYRIMNDDEYSTLSFDLQFILSKERGSSCISQQYRRGSRKAREFTICLFTMSTSLERKLTYRYTTPYFIFGTSLWENIEDSGTFRTV